MYLTIQGPTDVNGNRREILVKAEAVEFSEGEVRERVHVSAEEFRRLAESWGFPLNDEDAGIAFCWWECSHCSKSTQEPEQYCNYCGHAREAEDGNA